MFFRGEELRGSPLVIPVYICRFFFIFFACSFVVKRCAQKAAGYPGIYDFFFGVIFRGEEVRGRPLVIPVYVLYISDIT